MNRQHFQTLLDRYINGECTEQERKLVEQWFSLQGEEFPQNLASPDDQTEEQLWKAIQKQSFQTTVIPIWKRLSVAVAVITVLWGLSTYFMPRPAEKAAVAVQSSNLETQTNSSDSLQIIHLTDGSEVHLTSGSSISYPPSFDKQHRKVYLKGKAFFKITKDSSRPFLVHSGEVITKVLGTSFWISGNNNNASIEIAVVSGKVAVEHNVTSEKKGSTNIKGGVILTANQRVKYIPLTHTFETGLVDEPIPIFNTVPTPKSSTLLFDDAPLTTVIEKLANTYGIEIILENELLSKCLFKGDISNQPLYTQLELLCSSINATYEVRGTRILISGKGCSTLNSATYDIT